jgi:hypothetical protein
MLALLFLWVVGCPQSCGSFLTPTRILGLVPCPALPQKMSGIAAGVKIMSTFQTIGHVVTPYHFWQVMQIIHVNISLPNRRITRPHHHFGSAVIKVPAGLLRDSSATNNPDTALSIICHLANDRSFINHCTENPVICKGTISIVLSGGASHLLISWCASPELILNPFRIQHQSKPHLPQTRAFCNS